jgi:copper chaperone CopZ
MSIKILALAAAIAAFGLPAAAQPKPMPMPMAPHSHEGLTPAQMAEHMKTHKAEDTRAKAGPAVAAPDVVVKVNGLVCDFCARSLEKTFRRTGKVSGVSVDLTAKEVRLKFAAGANLDDAVIRKLVKDAGYAVVDVRRKAA